MDKVNRRTQSCSTLARFILVVSGVTGCSDTLVPAPTAPIAVTATLTAPTSVHISWEFNSDVERIDRYKVYRGGVEVGEAATNSYLDEGLADRASLTYTVVAVGSTGYESQHSAPATIMTGDATPPRVVQAFPANGAGPLSVAQSIVVKLVFSESIDSASVNSSTLSMKVVETGQVVTGTIRYRSNVAVAEFEPSFMPAASTIQVTATTGIRDLAANPLATSFTFAFTTTENTPPTIVATFPSNGTTGVDLRQTITIKFSEAMDPGSLRTRIFDLSSNLPADFVPFVGTYDPVANTQTLTAGLQSLRTYEVIVGWSFPATDLAGNRLAGPNSFKFSTRDAGPPIPVEVTPPRNATDVDPAAPIRITFSKPLDPASITAQRFVVYPSRPTGDGPVAGTISYEATSNTAVFTPSSPLKNATWYGVSVHSLTGADGVAMEDKDRVSYEFLTR